jgi:hypothetical protein
MNSPGPGYSCATKRHRLLIRPLPAILNRVFKRVRVLVRTA